MYGENGMESIKWIGFDMDDCLANLYYLQMFVQAFGVEPLVEPLVTSEQAKESHFFRDGIVEIVELVANAYTEKKIFGSFVYSNNGNERIPELCLNVLNRIAEKRCGVRPFLAAFHRNMVGRTGTQDKSWEDLLNCLHVCDLPLPSNKESLVYFDDMNHILGSEIPNYVIVPKFRRVTTPQEIAKVFMPAFKDTDMPQYVDAICGTHTYFEKHYKHRKPTEEVYSVELFKDAILKFTHG